MIEDRLLIRKLKRGDVGALCRVYEKYKADLVKVAWSLLDDRGAVEDVIHDVFVSFAQKASAFRLTGSLKAFLAICVANRSRDYNRSSRLRVGVDIGEVELEGKRSDTSVEVLISNEMCKVIADAVGMLPVEQREVVVLRLQTGMRFGQIAKSRGVSVNTVRSRYRYGLEKLRVMLNGIV